MSYFQNYGLNFNSHVKYACEKASKAINAIAIIMPNNSGPSRSKRRLLASVSSILKYGGPAWVAALETKQNQSQDSECYRRLVVTAALGNTWIGSDTQRHPSVRRNETPEHVVFHCPRFESVRREMSVFHEENVVVEMCREKNTWNAVSKAVTQIMSELQRKWTEEQRSSNAS
ncbi:uncharacterized protein LOC135706633 [Ochlerotatus camptorhynchus]|uniref:uncharacterized protein LOC135706633 n=1 Tax=Ochlerotatus camptorhynchus TaxID=644619 RepID=UPI0031D81E65